MNKNRCLKVLLGQKSPCSYLILSVLWRGIGRSTCAVPYTNIGTHNEESSKGMDYLMVDQ